MADMQDITMAVTQAAIEAMKAAAEAMTVVGAEVSASLRNDAVNMGPKLGGPSLKPTFDWS